MRAKRARSLGAVTGRGLVDWIAGRSRRPMRKGGYYLLVAVALVGVSSVRADVVAHGDISRLSLGGGAWLSADNRTLDLAWEGWTKPTLVEIELGELRDSRLRVEVKLIDASTGKAVAYSDVVPRGGLECFISKGGGDSGRLDNLLVPMYDRSTGITTDETLCFGDGQSYRNGVYYLTFEVSQRNVRYRADVRWTALPLPVRPVQAQSSVQAPKVTDSGLAAGGRVEVLRQAGAAVQQQGEQARQEQPQGEQQRQEQLRAQRAEQAGQEELRQRQAQAEQQRQEQARAQQAELARQEQQRQQQAKADGQRPLPQVAREAPTVIQQADEAERERQAAMRERIRQQGEAARQQNERARQAAQESQARFLQGLRDRDAQVAAQVQRERAQQAREEQVRQRQQSQQQREQVGAVLGLVGALSTAQEQGAQARAAREQAEREQAEREQEAKQQAALQEQARQAEQELERMKQANAMATEAGQRLGDTALQLKIYGSPEEAQRDIDRAERAKNADRVTFRFNKSYPGTVYVRLYSLDREQIWPASGKAYAIEDYGVQDISVQAKPGERICYGAWVSGSRDDFWGAGKRGAKPEGVSKTDIFTCDGGTTSPINIK